MKVADGHFHWQIFKFSRHLNYSKLCTKEIEFCREKIQEKHENHWMTMQSTIKVINCPYKFMADRLSIL